MEKTLKILHKKLDKKYNADFFKKQSKEMETLFAFDKIPYSNKKEFDFYVNEINYHGIQNKQAIEKAFKTARINMDDYYDALSYEQKNKLMDYEIKKSLETLPCFKYEDEMIYIPFFDMHLNHVYNAEVPLFDLKKYADLMLFYKEKMQNNIYGYEVYASSFSSLQFVLKQDENCALYCDKRKKLYFLSNFEMEEYIVLENINLDIMQNIASAYFNKNVDLFVELLLNNAVIDEKLYKKINKKRK